MWFLYVLECNDGSLYTGVTTDVNRRLNEHNTSDRGAKYTKVRRPVRLVWYREYPTRSEAQSEEYRFKKLTRKNKLKIINQLDKSSNL